MRAPLLLFVYNRKRHTERAIEYIERNSLVNETDLYIFCDGNKSEKDLNAVLEVRNFVNEYRKRAKFRNVTIIESDKNKGLAKSIIDGVSDVLKIREKVIVLEDDLVVSDDFLDFMNRALDYYENDIRINSVGGYVVQSNVLKKNPKDVCFLKVFECWGWAIWKNRWEKIDWTYEYYCRMKDSKEMMKYISDAGKDLEQMLYDYINGEIDTWAVRVACDQAVKGKFTVVPCNTKVQNIGLDGSGTNCGNEQRCTEKVNSKNCTLCPFYIDRKIERNMYNLRSKQYFLWNKFSYKSKMILKKLLRVRERSVNGESRR